MFDTEAFLSQTVEGAGSTEFVPVPENVDNPDKYAGSSIEKLETRTVNLKSGETQVILECTWNIQDNDGDVAKATGRDKNTCRQSIWLDISPGGGLEMGSGKNLQLNRLREALGQNVEGQKWHPQMLLGVPAKPIVSHRITDDTTYAEVKRVFPL